MKILLTTLNSKYVHSNIALKYLYASAINTKNKLLLKEFTINNDENYVFSEIMMGKYDVVCFSCYIWNIEKILYLCSNLKKAQPMLRIVLGGPEVSFDTVELMKKYKFIDIVIRGEGEETFFLLCEKLASFFGKKTAVCNEKQDESISSKEIVLDDDFDNDFSKINGLTYRAKGKIFVNEAAEQVKFENVPFPYDYLPCETDKVIYYESSRGCPYNCAYCISSLEKKMRALPTERVFKELDYFLIRRVKQVKFIDRTFNWDRKRCFDIFEYLIKNDNGVTNFHFELCGELLNQQIFELLRTARKGLFQFEIGIQSTNAVTLRAVNRNEDVSRLLTNILRLTQMDKIHIHIDLIAGLPHEDYETFRNSFNRVYKLKADALQLGFLKLLRGTKIRQEAARYEYLYREKAPYEVISNKFISSRDLVVLKEIEEVFDLYHNRDGFKNILEFFTENKSFKWEPFDFFEEFALFYHLKGYQHVSHKKEDLYRILYEYIAWKNRNGFDIFEVAISLLEEDMKTTLNFDAIKKFKKRGWELA